jgi:hypothetical protein
MKNFHPKLRVKTLDALITFWWRILIRNKGWKALMILMKGFNPKQRLKLSLLWNFCWKWQRTLYRIGGNPPCWSTMKLALASCHKWWLWRKEWLWWRSHYVSILGIKHHRQSFDAKQQIKRNLQHLAVGHPAFKRKCHFAVLQTCPQQGMNKWGTKFLCLYFRFKKHSNKSFGVCAAGKLVHGNGSSGASTLEGNKFLFTFMAMKKSVAFSCRLELTWWMQS